MQRRSPFIMNKVGVCAEYSQVGKAVRFCQNSEGCGTYRYQREPCINFVREISFGNRHGG